MRIPSSSSTLSLATATALLMSACASGPPVNAEWHAPELQARSGLLHGAVLVACDTPDAAVRNVCQDQVAAQLVARGARAILPSPETQIATDRPLDEQFVANARSVDARAVLIVSLRPVASETTGPSLSFGLGGFGFGRGSASGGGIGATVPIGQQRVATAFGANGRVTDVASGRMVWTASATAPISEDLRAQMTDLSQALLGSADRAGLL